MTAMYIVSRAIVGINVEVAIMQKDRTDVLNK